MNSFSLFLHGRGTLDLSIAASVGWQEDTRGSLYYILSVYRPFASSLLASHRTLYISAWSLPVTSLQEWLVKLSNRLLACGQYLLPSLHLTPGSSSIWLLGLAGPREKPRPESQTQVLVLLSSNLGLALSDRNGPWRDLFPPSAPSPDRSIFKMM